MIKTPKALRLQIGLFGRTNVGKSSFLNMISGQDSAMVSKIPGTTTDVVEKSMELLPIGPVVFLDTPGLDDESILSEKRIQRAKKIYDRADVIAMVIEPGIFGVSEQTIIDEARKKALPVILVVNKCDESSPSKEWLESLKKSGFMTICVSSIDPTKSDEYIEAFKERLLKTLPKDYLAEPALVGDLLPPEGFMMLIVPIDLQAPKGRLILPQVQAIRDALDNDAATMIVKEREYPVFLEQFMKSKKPDLVVCDSQVVLKMVADTPKDIPCTTFSVLFARYKGSLIDEVKALAAIDRLKNGDRILIAEACSHHALEDDIGTVKIPRWLKQYTGCQLNVHVCKGRDYPEDLSSYKLVIHCGACMITRREMLFRVKKVKDQGSAITNYGLCISFLQGVIKRVLSPFPGALIAFERECLNKEKDHE